MMLTTQNITSKTLQNFYHMKYTNLCNEKKKAKPSTPRYLCRNPSFGLATKAKGVARLWAKKKPGSQAKRKLGSQSKKKPGSQSKKKLRSHITYSQECV